jgi:hypothetical protein
MSSRSRRHFLGELIRALLSSFVCDAFSSSKDPWGGAVWMGFSRGKERMSWLCESAPRTRDMLELSKTVAAERGQVLRKKERSRTRIARFTGGRNMTRRSLRRVPWALCSESIDKKDGYTYMYTDTKSRMSAKIMKMFSIIGTNESSKLFKDRNIIDHGKRLFVAEKKHPIG